MAKMMKRSEARLLREWGPDGRLAQVSVLLILPRENIPFTLPVRATSFEDAREKAAKMLQYSNAVGSFAITGIDIFVSQMEGKDG